MNKGEYSIHVNNDKIIAFLDGEKYIFTQFDFEKLCQLIDAANFSNVGVAYFDKNGNIHSVNKE